MSDLVEQLRFKWRVWATQGGCLELKAADRIEALEAERDTLQRAQGYTYIGRNGKAVLARDLEDKIEALEAALAKADELAEAVADNAWRTDREKETLIAYRQARDAAR